MVVPLSRKSAIQEGVAEVVRVMAAPLAVAQLQVNPVTGVSLDFVVSVSQGRTGGPLLMLNEP